MNQTTMTIRTTSPARKIIEFYKHDYEGILELAEQTLWGDAETFPVEDECLLVQGITSFKAICRNLCRSAAGGIDVYIHHKVTFFRCAFMVTNSGVTPLVGGETTFSQLASDMKSAIGLENLNVLAGVFFV